jgi:hypothetical protein
MAKRYRVGELIHNRAMVDRINDPPSDISILPLELGMVNSCILGSRLPDAHKPRNTFPRNRMMDNPY